MWYGVDPGRNRVGPDQKGNGAEHRGGAPDPMPRPRRAHTLRPVTDSLSVGRSQCTLRTMAAHTRAPWQKGERLGHSSDECEKGEVQVRQGQGVTKAKGERQLEPRHVGPGTGKVMPQMPGYLAHHATLPPQTASRACQWSIRPTYARDGRCWYGIGERVGKWRQPPPAVAALRPARSRRPRL